MPKENRNVEAILWVLLSTALFTVIFSAAKLADGAIGTFQLLFLRFIGAGVTLVCIAVFSGPIRQNKSTVPHMHFVRALFGCSAVAAITWATAHMPVADASAIGILYGVITVLLGVLFLKERVGVSHGLAVLVSLLGATLIMLNQGALQSEFAMLPALIALLSAILMASEGLMIRILSLTESAMSMMLYMAGFGILLFAIPAAIEWRSVNSTVVLGCLALGPLSVVAQYCTIRGYRIAPLSVVGPVDYSWLVFAMILGVIAFGEYPTFGSLAGGFLIIAGGFALTRLHTRGATLDAATD